MGYWTWSDPPGERVEEQMWSELPLSTADKCRDELIIVEFSGDYI